MIVHPIHSFPPLITDQFSNIPDIENGRNLQTGFASKNMRFGCYDCVIRFVVCANRVKLGNKQGEQTVKNWKIG